MKFLGWLLSRLTYPQKFLLISAVFLLPLGSLLWFFNNELNNQVVFDLQELKGLELLPRIKDLFNTIGDQITDATLKGNPDGAAPQSLLAAQGELRHASLTLGESTGATIPEFFQTSGSKSLSDLRQTVFDDFQILGNHSNLILDPDLATYYMVDAIVLKWRRFQELLFAIKALTLQITQHHHLDAVEQTELKADLEELHYNYDRMQMGYASFLEHRPDAHSQQEIKASFSALTAAESAAEASCEHDLLDAEQGRVVDLDFSREFQPVVDAADAYWRSCAEVTNRLLHQRIAQIQQRRLLAMVCVVALLALALSLYIAFYNGVMNVVRVIQGAAARMDKGDYVGVIELQTRDELSTVLQSFNTVAARLREEYQQMLEEKERALAAEASLRQSEARFRNLFENSLNGIFQISPEGKFLAANRSLAKIYGYDQIRDFVRDIEAQPNRFYVDPERRREFDGLLKIYGLIKEFVSEVRQKEGRHIWILETALAVRNERGEILYYEGTVVDVTIQREFEEKHRQVLDSIHYGQVIQAAILPTTSEIKKWFVGSALLFRPRDIVSGDFYWLAHMGDQVFLAVIDCTGHGVPGAFMSLIGFSLLNKIVKIDDIHEPAQILHQLDIEMRAALHQQDKENQANDGMDICLCRFTREHVTFAGSHRPLYYYQDQSLQVIKGDIRAVGSWQRRNSVRPFRQHTIHAKQRTTFYLTSDGLADQPNAEGQKFGSKEIQRFIEEHGRLEPEEQYQLLTRKFAQHQGTRSQRDDITCLIVAYEPEHFAAELKRDHAQSLGHG